MFKNMDRINPKLILLESINEWHLLLNALEYKEDLSCLIATYSLQESLLQVDIKVLAGFHQCLFHMHQYLLMSAKFLSPLLQ